MLLEIDDAEQGETLALAAGAISTGRGRCHACRAHCGVQGGVRDPHSGGTGRGPSKKNRGVEGVGEVIAYEEMATNKEILDHSVFYLSISQFVELRVLGHPLVQLVAGDLA